MNLFVILNLEAHILLISEIVLSEKLENKINLKDLKSIIMEVSLSKN